MDVLFSEN
jgi:hypothetical protein